MSPAYDDFDKYADLLEQGSATPHTDRQPATTPATPPAPAATEHRQAERHNTPPRPPRRDGGRPETTTEETADADGLALQERICGPIPTLSDDLQKNVDAYLGFLNAQKEREKTPEFQEALQRRKQCFSPETEKTFAAYLLQRGLVTEQQARDYLRKVTNQ